MWYHQPYSKCWNLHNMERAGSRERAFHLENYSRVWLNDCCELLDACKIRCTSYLFKPQIYTLAFRMISKKTLKRPLHVQNTKSRFNMKSWIRGGEARIHVPLFQSASCQRRKKDSSTHCATSSTLCQQLILWRFETTKYEEKKRACEYIFRTIHIFLAKSDWKWMSA